ncbi:hypothetical protein BDY19DRAFT_1081067 [Irpex rosettiformis]|uniref:Uncharacterized protein n=1 Tax=Irpex rosettiformis TaxID=378272 RepID=A0ACB8UL59_9APHY|nr:hypothetical protein BDY19DRAFT_1081067 [Irpex rosettiformis]
MLLSISPSATVSEVKSAYHRALLKYHPDKQITPQTQPPASYNDIGLLKLAYETLVVPETRAKYDADRTRKSISPRPAQVISLEDFTELDDDPGWTYGCRCGGAYVIMEQDLEKGQHLVGCNSCSEVIWAGYELVTEDKDAV